MTDHDDRADLVSTPRGEGIRDVLLTDRWNTPLARPNGGYVLAVLLRGLKDEVASGPPLVASVSYLGAPLAGPAEMRTEVLRRGRRVSSGTAALVQDGRTTTHLTASFGVRDPAADRPVPDLQHLAAPDLPTPEHCVDAGAAAGVPGGLMDRLDHRLAPGPSFRFGTPSRVLETAMWQRFRDGRLPDHAELALLTDSFPPVVMEYGGRGSLTIQLTVHLHALPASPWIATRVTTRHVRDGLHEQDCDLFDAEGTLLAQGRQFALLA